ncbi:hypothetical protein [Citricoccus sp.]|uniref:hypothetical protein n=1 Tax=Citricoccus sp. TaxID=1978372 RepID=UPI00263709C0|nr:hypothetical protein [Citricoccus sp.]HRO30386.1 hypothetical protein [Citricoccus sp.]HRO92452.1 hypothetical protein [Citricoccus sp.]
MSKKTTAPTLEDRINSGVDQAAHWAAPKMEAALAWAEKGLGEGKVRGKAASRQASGRAHDALDLLTPQVKAGLHQANTALAGAVGLVTPAVDTARHKVQDEYVPAASGRLADVAGHASKAAHHAKVSPAVENALINLTGDKKAVRKLRKAAEEYAKSAEKRFKKQAKKHGKSGHKGWLVAGIVVAAGAAAVAVWQLTKPVDDPWKTPAPAPLQNQGATGADPDLTTRAPSAPAATTTTATTATAAGQGDATAPAPAVAAGNAVVDTAEEKVDGVPAPKSAE